MQNIYWPGTSNELGNIDLQGHSAPNDIYLSGFNENLARVTNGQPLPGISDTYSGTNDYGLNDFLGRCQSNVIYKLASLNVALYECAATLPFKAEVGGNSTGVSGSEAHNSRNGTLFAIDEIFRLTSGFIEVMKALGLKECDTNATLPSMDLEQVSPRIVPPQVVHSPQTSSASQSIHKVDFGASSRILSQLDEATRLMVVSCHLRLTEIYVSIFQLIQGCIEHMPVPRTTRDWAVMLPQLQLGSISAPPMQVGIDTSISSATKSMYMLMVTIFSMQLWDQLADVMNSGADVSTDITSSSGRGVTDSMWDQVTHRTGRVSQIIGDTRHLLQEYR